MYQTDCKSNHSLNACWKCFGWMILLLVLDCRWCLFNVKLSFYLQYKSIKQIASCITSNMPMGCDFNCNSFYRLILSMLFNYYQIVSFFINNQNLLNEVQAGSFRICILNVVELVLCSIDLDYQCCLFNVKPSFHLQSNSIKQTAFWITSVMPMGWDLTY
jgi:hypothetical protein